MDITIAETEDIPFLCDLLNLLFTQEAEFVPDPKLQEKGLTKIITADETGDILIARDHGEIVGMVNLLYTISTAFGTTVALLEDMVVAPERRGEGVGSALMMSAISHATKRGCRRITLLTDADNEKAQHFYKKHGFYQSSMIAFRKLLNR